MNTPLGEALQDAIQKSVDKIAAGIARVPWKVSIATLTGGNPSARGDIVKLN